MFPCYPNAGLLPPDAIAEACREKARAYMAPAQVQSYLNHGLENKVSPFQIDPATIAERITRRLVDAFLSMQLVRVALMAHACLQGKVAGGAGGCGISGTLVLSDIKEVLTDALAALVLNHMDMSHEDFADLLRRSSFVDMGCGDGRCFLFPRQLCAAA